MLRVVDILNHEFRVDSDDQYHCYFPLFLPFNQGDPAVIKNVIDQLSKLQKEAGVKRSPFIKPFMRPMVGSKNRKLLRHPREHRSRGVS